MNTYHKIQTLFKRDPETNFKTLLEGDFARSEFKYLKDNDWIFTEKVDGMNIRVMWNGEHVTFGGKSDRAQIPGPLLAVLHNDFIETMADVFPHSGIREDDVCLYGEGYGGKIQKGSRYGEQAFVLFDVKIHDLWLEQEAVRDIGQKLEIGVVPEIFTGRLDRGVDLVRRGFVSSWGVDAVLTGDLFQAEGWVARPVVELLNRRGERVITKLKCKDFGGI